MTVNEFATISMALKAAYPNSNLMPDKQSKEVWYTMLSDLDYMVCMTAIKEIISGNKFAPSIAEIREKCTGLTSIPIKDYGEAWESVLTAIRKYGWPEELKALESLDELTRKCVKRIGFVNICMSENIAADRANFRMIYETEANRKKMDNQLSPRLKTEKQKMIDTLISNAVKQISLNE